MDHRDSPPASSPTKSDELSRSCSRMSVGGGSVTGEPAGEETEDAACQLAGVREMLDSKLKQTAAKAVLKRPSMASPAAKPLWELLRS